MRRAAVVASVALLVLVALAATLSMAGGRQYQFTGVVTEVDAKSLAVKKGEDTWVFSIEGKKGLPKLKKEDKVTVYYTMTAEKIETK